MLTAEQIEQRRTLVTASDVAAVCGLNPWKTALDVWAEKVHGSTFHGNWRTKRGDAVEPALVSWLGDKLAPTLEVRPAGGDTLTHRIHTWLGATCDALVYLPDGKGAPVATGEAKTSDDPSKWRDEEDGWWKVADHYAPQVQTQMTVLGVKRAYVAADLRGESEPIVLAVDHDPDLECALLEACEHFHRVYLLPKVEPPTDGATYREIANVFRKPRRPALAATPEVEELAARFLAFKGVERDAKAKAEEIQGKIAAIVGDAEGVQGEGWRLLWKWQDEIPVAAHVRAGSRKFDLREVKTTTKQSAAGRRGKAA